MPDKTKRKARSRTLTMTDDEWQELCDVVDVMGFGERGRSRGVMKLVRDEAAREKRRNAE